MLREIQKVARLGSWELDFATQQATWSEEAYAIMGLANGSAIPSLEAFLQHVHPEDIEQVNRVIDSALVSFENYSFYCRIIQSGGKQVYIFGKGIFEFENNIPIRLFGIIHDITEFKKIRDELCISQMMGQEKERERFSRELHDGLGQMLASINLQLKSLGNTLHNAQTLEKLNNIRQNLQNTIKEVRSISHDMSPVMFRKCGLRESLKNLCASAPGIKFSLQTNLKEKLDDTTEIILFRAAQELVSNIVKHSSATRASLKLIRRRHGLFLKVRDNGVGYKETATGLGLDNIRNRISLLNGDLHIPELKKGFGVDIYIPYKIQTDGKTKRKKTA